MNTTITTAAEFDALPLHTTVTRPGGKPRIKQGALSSAPQDQVWVYAYDPAGPTPTGRFTSEEMAACGPWTVQESATRRVAAAAEQVAAAEDTLAMARQERDAAVLAALDAGAVLAQVARTAGLTRQAIYNLKNQRP